MTQPLNALEGVCHEIYPLRNAYYDMLLHDRVACLAYINKVYCNLFAWTKTGNGRVVKTLLCFIISGYKRIYDTPQVHNDSENKDTNFH